MTKDKHKRKKSQIPFRLNIIFFIVFTLFSILIIQLGIVQILKGESYQDEIDKTVKETTKIPVPRGKLLDSQYNVIVDNKPLYSITYTPPKGVQAKDNLDLAIDLSHFISMRDEEGKLPKLSTRNKKEYWYLENEEEALSRLKEEEIQSMKPGEQYQTTLDRITEEDLKDLTEEDFEVIAIKRELDKAYALAPQVIKNENISPEEYARVAEHLDQLPGINASIDWDREYPYENTFRTFLGSITSQDEGILAQKEQYYLTRGYQRNDRVGRSGLEEYYEDFLKGRKEQIQYTTNKSGQVVDSEVMVEGERGKDLVLTIDMEFQEQVDQILRDELEIAINRHPSANRFLNEAMAVVIQPKTGELLAVSGQRYNRETREFENVAFKTLYDSHRPGSVVKGATVLAGYQSGVITPNQTFNDRPIKIQGSPTLSSWTNLGIVNDLEALRRSSNVYMAFIAMRMGGEYNYQPNKKIQFQREAFQEMRNYFNQFGLGTKTGIDFPYEEIGLVGNIDEGAGGKMQHFSIGQFDTYTTMQLAQYVSTIANDGYRMRPHFLKEIREPAKFDDELGPLYRKVNADVMNRVEMDTHLVKRVQEGFRQVFQTRGGTGFNYWSDRPYNPAGKTGTAETEQYENGREYSTQNLTLIGYAPFDDPEVAFAVIVPHLGNISGQYQINHFIGRSILDTYFDVED